ncbi:DUF4158 domain-containing protein [Photorhabdus tasmaniensis]|uniref:DUF4158 domain-containing protein n=1 Tax=Photorhabdus tasmaniensis TaxID=1004159 RepID=UPI00140A6954
MERESLLALPDDELTLKRMAYFSEHDLALISAHRKPASRNDIARPDTRLLLTTILADGIKLGTLTKTEVKKCKR